MTEARRPSPEALLKAARREARGRLKIFIGAAPGVGKTYEMLLQGAALRREGRDVVIGLVETHGRAETQALVAPFELVPRRRIAHGGHVLSEMDLDGLLTRSPAVALVDELAHTNAPGCRHAKRWQDVEELRDAGIDVLTTLNVQHIESLNDVVAGFTGVRVQETVPDPLLDDAEIEVVDLPPDELIGRLRDGKVYEAAEARRALGHFFTRANLTALRELALRRAAQTVDRQMRDWVDTTGTSGHWAASERVMVALGPHGAALALVRAGKRLADALRAPWSAVTVELPRPIPGDDPEARELAQALQLAVQLGATLVTVPAATVPAGIEAYAAEIHATALVIGQSRQRRWRRMLRGTLADRLAHRLPAATVHLVPVAARARRRRDRGDRVRGSGGIGSAWRGTAAGLVLVAATSVANLLLAGWLGTNPLDMLYLVPVIATATLWGLRPALVASVAAAVAYNFLFLPPIHTLTIEDPQNLVTFAVLAGVGILASRLAGRLRDEADLGARTAAQNAAIAAFGQRLASVSTEAETAQAVCEDVASLLGCAAMVVKADDATVRVVRAVPPEPAWTALDQAAAAFALSRGEVAGRATATLSAAGWQFHPMRTALGTLGLVGIADTAGGDPLPPPRRLLFATLLGQASLAHERLRLEGASGSSQRAGQSVPEP